MSNPLQDVCDQIAAVVGAVEGIRRATGKPPEQISEFPFVDVYVASATWGARPNGMITGLVTVTIDLHLARKDQPREAEQMHKYQYAIINALFLALKNSTLTSLSTINDVGVQLTVFAGGAGQGSDTIGYRITPQVKVQGVIQ